jgi:hypothetical protein
VKNWSNYAVTFEGNSDKSVVCYLCSCSWIYCIENQFGTRHLVLLPYSYSIIFFKDQPVEWEDGRGILDTDG